MPTIIPAALSALRRVVPAAVVASALVLGLCPAVANAEWDIQKYDECMKKPHGPSTGDYVEAQYHWFCCVNSGGVWNTAQQKCEAPPANAQEPAPPRELPGAPPTQILVPGNPPPANNAGG